MEMNCRSVLGRMESLHCWWKHIVVVRCTANHESSSASGIMFSFPITLVGYMNAVHPDLVCY